MTKKIKIICTHCKKESLIWEHSKATFCSYQCSADYKRDSFINKWLAEEINGTFDSSENMHKRIKKWYKNNIFNCEVCNIDNTWNGKLLVFEIDHIDGNRKNNWKSNLRYICPNCHSQTDTFRAKNAMKNKVP